MQSSSTAAEETGSKQQFESDRDVYSHPPSSTYFWKRILTDALEDHEGTVSFRGRIITNLRFADDIDGLASTTYGMEISAEKTKLMKNTISSIKKKKKRAK